MEGNSFSKIKEESEKYNSLEKRVSEMFCGKFSLEQVIDELERQLEEPGKPHPVYARILTYEDAEKWERWKVLEKEHKLVELP